jgi:GTP-binding protein EngB required for normal cell division
VSALRLRRVRKAEEPTREALVAELGQRLDALDRLLAAADGRVDAARLEEARELSGRAGERLRLSTDHTVVALAGATGSGKSSLFNAVTGLELSAVGVRRPTTGIAHACIWGPEGATPLLDWIGIPRRHQVVRESVLDGEEQAALRGLVLLDLPDHDSTNLGHRLEVDRLVGVVDLMVWVLDPQKYADAAIHDRYLSGLAGHAAVTVVVLNQADRLTPPGLAECLTDVRRLLAVDGLVGTRVLATSATTKLGLDELREVLAETVAARHASIRRLAADVDTAYEHLASLAGPPVHEEVDRTVTHDLAVALAAAAGVPAVADAVGHAYRYRAQASAGWPFARWVRKLRPDPLRRLRLTTEPDPATEPVAEPAIAEPAAVGAAAAGGMESGTVVRPGGEASGRSRRARAADRVRLGPDVVDRTSVPATGAMQRSAVDLAVRALADTASADLPDPWPATVRTAARSKLDGMPDALDRVIATTDLGLSHPPLWWRAAAIAQGAFAGAAVGGAAWLAALLVFGLLRLPEPATPAVGAVPWPTLLLLGGLGLGLLLSAAVRPLARAGAHRARAVAEGRLRDAVGALGRERVIAPVRAELSAYASLREALEALRRTGKS